MIRQDRTRSVARATEQARRDGRVLTKALTTELGVVMAGAFGDAQSKIPIDSGALLASGRHGTDVRDGGDTWIGYMAWGGESNPHEVDYAIYVLAHGGEHDWLRDAWAYNEAIEATIDRHIGKHLR